MGIIRRHIISSVAVSVYLLWWGFMIYIISKSHPKEFRCDFAPVFFLLVTPFIAGLLVTTFFVRMGFAKPLFRDDYLKFIAVVTAPLCIGLLWFAMG